MKVTKKKDYYLLSNEMGEYHLSHDEFEQLGESQAIELATKEIEKKLKLGQYTNNTINFKQARKLGFCKYGINDFCDRLGLDNKKEYTISLLLSKIDIGTMIEYPNECLKVFGDSLFDKFGGVSNILKEKRTRKVLNFVINSGKIDDYILRELAYLSAMRVISNFEKHFPNDDRPRKAIEAGKLFNEGKIDDAARSAAYSAAEVAVWLAGSAACSAAPASAAARLAVESAYSAARSAARSEARLAARLAAESAARSVAYSAVESVAESVAYSVWSAADQNELDFQIDTLLKLLENKND